MGTTSKALSLLDFFSRAQPLIGLSQMSRLAGINKASTHRLLGELADFGLVEQVTPGREYRLGPAFLRLAALREQNVPMRETAYALACDVAAADLDIVESEMTVLQQLRWRLSIDRLTAAAIERGARARHQTI